MGDVVMVAMMMVMIIMVLGWVILVSNDGDNYVNVEINL